jgi:hypothetical protein
LSPRITRQALHLPVLASRFFGCRSSMRGHGVGIVCMRNLCWWGGEDQRGTGGRVRPQTAPQLRRRRWERVVATRISSFSIGSIHNIPLSLKGIRRVSFCSTSVLTESWGDKMQTNLRSSRSSRLLRHRSGSTCLARNAIHGKESMPHAHFDSSVCILQPLSPMQVTI